MIRMSKKYILAGLLAVLLLLLTSAAFADTATVTASSLYMREGPDSSTAVIRVLRTGAKLQVISKQGNWYEVSYGKDTGYVYKDYVVISKDDSDTLAQGDKGTAVKDVQKRLRELGYYKVYTQYG